MASKLPFLALCMALGCGGSARSKPPSGPTVETPASGARADSDVDALWALAPADTVLGVVVAPGATLKLYDMAAELLRVVEARPLGAELMVEGRKRISELPFNIFDRKAFLSAGLDLSRGAALFVDANKKGTIILPVSDRAAFRAFTDSALKTVAGTEVDVFGDAYFCTMRNALYVCMEDATKLVEHIAGTPSSLAERVYRLPSNYRGDAEAVIDLEAFKTLTGDSDPELDKNFSDLGLLAGVVKLGRGSISARAWMQATPKGDVAKIVSSGDTVGALSTGAGAMRPTSFARMIVPLAAFLDEVPDQTLPGGASLRDDIFGKMTGEFVAYTPASETSWARFAIGITEAQNFRALLNMGCALIPPMDFLEVERGENRCSFIVDVDKVAGLDDTMRSMFSGKLPMAVAVEEDQVSLTVGTEAPVVLSSSVSAIGRELLYKEWSYSLWTQNFSIVSGLGEPWSEVINSQPKDMREKLQFGLWLLAHVSEFAAAVSVQADGVHMLAHIGSYASDSDEAYKAYEAAVAKSIEVGDTSAEFAEIRRRWPQSQAAQQSAAAGLFSEVFAELLARISVPAFVRYMQRSSSAPEAVADPAMAK